MHHFVLVLVPADTQNIKKAVSGLLERYSAYNPVEVHKRYINGPNLQDMAEHYGLSETDLPALAQYLKDYWGDRWEEVNRDGLGVVEGGIDEEGLFFTYPDNPECKWDFWHIGGRWDEVIQGKSRNTKGRGNYGPEHEQLQYNICPVKELPKNLLAWEIVTPDGQWHEGEWWLTPFGEEEQRATEQAHKWRKIMWELLEQYADCIAVGIDTHL